MNAWPVIIRELRAESRHGTTYSLRFLGTALLVLACLVALGESGHLPPARMGLRVFGGLDNLLSLATVFLAPAIAADCLSREKREGTLGLLFLTQLKAGEIVTAKGLVHGLRAFSVLLAALPILCIPLLMGGVSWNDAVFSAALHIISLLLGLAAGLIASAQSREQIRSLLLAVILSVGLNLLFAFLTLMTCAMLIPGKGLGIFQDGTWLAVFNEWSTILTSQNGDRGRYLNLVSARGVWLWMGPLLGLVILAVLTLLAAIKLSARQIGLFWRDDIPSARKLWLTRIFCTPLLMPGRFKRRRRRTLMRSPAIWLQQYSWSGRLSKWGWCLVVALAEAGLILWHFNHSYLLHEYLVWQWYLPVLLVIGAAFTAVGSYRREWQSGVMELLLVTPLRVNQIIWGRLLAIGNQFLPSIIMIMSVWALMARWDLGGYGYYGHDGFSVRFFLLYWHELLFSFVFVSVTGMYFSLKRMHWFAAWLLTLLAFVAQMIVVYLIGVLAIFAFMDFSLRDPNLRGANGLFLILLLQWGLVARVWFRLHRNLTRRTFALNKYD